MELAIQDLRNHVIGCIEHVLVRCTPAARFRYHAGKRTTAPRASVRQAITTASAMLSPNKAHGPTYETLPPITPTQIGAATGGFRLVR